LRELPDLVSGSIETELDHIGIAKVAELNISAAVLSTCAKPPSTPARDSTRSECVERS
jgi:hypothetical protein